MSEFMQKYNNLGKTLIIISFLITLFIVVMGITYAYWSSNEVQKSVNKLEGGCLSIDFVYESDSIRFLNAYPMTEEEAMNRNPYTFTIQNTCTVDAYYIVTLNTTETEDLDQYVKYKLIDGDNNVVGPNLLYSVAKYEDYNGYFYKKSEEDPGYSILNSYILTGGSLQKRRMNEDYTQVLEEGESKTYNLYLWLDENMEMESEYGDTTMDKTFEGKIIVVSATQDLGDEATGMY